MVSQFFAPVNSQMCIFLCNQAFMPCKSTIKSLWVSLLTDSSYWASLITSCTDTFSHLRKSWSSVCLYILSECTSIKLIKFPAVSASVFPTSLNADVTAPTETAASWAASVTAASVICVPTMDPLSLSHLDLFLLPSRYKMIIGWASSYTCHRVNLYSLCFFHLFLIYSSF